MYGYEEDHMKTAPGFSFDYGDMAHEGKLMEEEINLASASQEVIGILVYLDEKEKKYLDVRTLMFLTGYEPSTKYVYPDGSEIVVSDSILIGKPGDVPEGWISSEKVFKDFSSTYPYDKELELYEVTDDELAELIARYETSHPNVRIGVDYKKISRDKERNKDKIYVDNFSNDSTIVKDDYEVVGIIDNKEYSSLDEDSIKYNNDSKYGDDLNLKTEEIDSMFKENDDEKYKEADNNNYSFHN